MRKIKKVIKRHLKVVLNKVGCWMYSYCCNVKSNRNVVLLLDSIREPNAPLIDNFAMFDYMMSLDACAVKPVYLVNEASPKAAELVEKYHDNVMVICKKKRIRTFLSLARIFKETFAVCQTTMGLQWLTFGADAALKRSKNVSNIFTQHGVTYFKDKFISRRMYGKKFFNKVMLSSVVEVPIFEERGGYSPDDIIRNGLFRWDSMLENRGTTVSKVIFLYFTYRYYMRKIRGKQIRESTYIRRIQELLDANTLRRMADAGYTIKMAVHHSALGGNYFTIPEFIEIVSEDDIASVKKEASVLVTDCSSMCFEMMKMSKPVIFYDLLDDEDCRKYRARQDFVRIAEKTAYLGFLTKGTRYSADMSSFTECLEEAVQGRISGATYEKLFFYEGDFRKRFYEYLVHMVVQNVC